MNNINIQFCAEDRERLDRLAAGLDRLAAALDRLAAALEKYPHKCENCAKTVAEGVASFVTRAVITPQDAPAESHENAPEATENEAATTEHPATESLPWEEPTPEAEAKPSVTLEQIQQKVIELAAGNNGAKKAKVREIVNAYAKKVSDLPVDKWGEVWAKLTALESEA